jgi:hypothetical protein
MVSVTYPSGVKAFATVLAAGTELSYTPTVLGSMELGEGAPVSGNKAALGVLFQFSLTANSSTALSLTFEVSDDGTSWYQMSEYNFSVTSALADSNFRLHLQPFTFGANAVRVSASINGTSPIATMGVQARLTEVFSVVSGGSGS